MFHPMEDVMLLRAANRCASTSVTYLPVRAARAETFSSVLVSATENSLLFSTGETRFVEGVCSRRV